MPGHNWHVPLPWLIDERSIHAGESGLLYGH